MVNVIDVQHFKIVLKTNGDGKCISDLEMELRLLAWPVNGATLKVSKVIVKRISAVPHSVLKIPASLNSQELSISFKYLI